MLIKEEEDKKTPSNDHGFPSGCFLLRSASSARFLDVASDSVQDSSPIILWPAKDSSLVEGKSLIDPETFSHESDEPKAFRLPEARNQEFFIDTTGALCARASGHALDIEGGRLVLRHRRPLTQPYPNAYSHPLPRFRYNGNNGRITVEFEHDPAFADGTAWRTQIFYVTALPRRRPRTLLDGATDVLTSAFRAPLSLLGPLGVPSLPALDPTAAGTDDTFNLREDEVEERDRGEDAEVDDDPARDRAVRVLGMTAEEHYELSDKAWARRQWEVLPLRATAARHSRPSS